MSDFFTLEEAFKALKEDNTKSYKISEPYEYDDVDFGPDNAVFCYQIVPNDFKSNPSVDLPYIEITGSVYEKDCRVHSGHVGPNWVPYGDRYVQESPAGREIYGVEYLGNMNNKNEFNAKIKYIYEFEEISFKEFKEMCELSDSDFEQAMKDIWEKVKASIEEDLYRRADDLIDYYGESYNKLENKLLYETENRAIKDETRKTKNNYKLVAENEHYKVLDILD